MTTQFLGLPTPTPEQFLAQIDRIGERLTLNVPALFNLVTLQALPQGTLGRTLADHFGEHHLPPLTTGPRRKQLHDVVHVLTGYGIDPVGELEVQAFMLGGKFFPTHLILGLALFEMSDRQRTDLKIDRRTILQRVWQAYQRGQRSGFDIDRWQPERQWHLPLIQVQQRLNLE
jgi:ubiquinone biosynthesis protein Coq4